MELNGVPATLEQVKALALTNYGHFTSMLVDDCHVRGLSLHMQRLARDCRQLFGTNLDTELVRHHVRKALGGEQGRVTARVTVYDPGLDLGTIGSDANPHVLVTTRPAPVGPSSPLRLQAASYQRESPRIKHIGLFGALKHRRDAQREGFDDVLLLNPDGTISEIATSNIGFVRGTEIVWPRSECLPGITMTLINQGLDEPVVTEPLTLSDLADFDAVFATNAATGIRAVTVIDGATWPAEHNMLRTLRALYEGIPGESL